jgi:enamine deaminase RidA (YjgF/YER057c/UK114 family)
MASTLKHLNELYPPDVKSTVPLGLRVNDMVYTTSLSAADPATGEISGDIKEQTAKALQRMKQMIERAGGTLDNVARGVGYCTNADDRTPVDQVWMEMFPNENDKPAMKVLLAELPPGQLVRIDALALLGGKRTRIDIPNVSAHDPTIKIGNWVFSSRCHGNNQETGQIVEGGLPAEARQTLENLTTLIKLAGGNESNIVQITTFGREPDYLDEARKAFEERFPDPAKRPALNQVVNFVSARMQVAMEMVAVLN